jgi:hypothetical protein
MLLRFMVSPGPLLAGEGISLESKNQQREPGGLRKRDRTWYPTLFGWEIGKRLAYFTTGHVLSSSF